MKSESESRGEWGGREGGVLYRETETVRAHMQCVIKTTGEGHGHKAVWLL